MPTYEDSSEQYDFDPDTIIQGAISSALLTSVEHAFTDSCVAEAWAEASVTGDRARGGFVGGDAEGNVSVVAWDGKNIVAFEHRVGVDADVAGGIEDLRRAVPGMPAELEGAFQRAAALLRGGPKGALGASAGLWVTPDAVGSSVFGHDDTYKPGREVLRWGVGPDEECEDESDEEDAPYEKAKRAESIVDALVARMGSGRVALAKEEADAILATGAAPCEGGVEQMKATFGAAGVDWPG